MLIGLPRYKKFTGEVLYAGNVHCQLFIPVISIILLSGNSSPTSVAEGRSTGKLEKLIPFGAAPLGIVATTDFYSMSMTDTVLS